MEQATPQASPNALSFKVHIAPAWEDISPALKKRAEACGIAWPAGLTGTKLASAYAAVVTGTSHRGETLLQVDVLQPPQQKRVHNDVPSWEALQLSFGARRRSFGPDVRPEQVDCLAVHLDSQGLLLPASEGLGIAAQRLLALPLPRVVDVVSRVMRGELQLRSAGVDHIVDKFAPPPELEGFALSRWRGDKSYRLSHPLARLEVWIS